MSPDHYSCQQYRFYAGKNDKVMCKKQNKHSVNPVLTCLQHHQALLKDIVRSEGIELPFLIFFKNVLNEFLVNSRNFLWNFGYLEKRYGTRSHVRHT